MRKPLIAGNWKMNGSKEQTKEYINTLKPLIKGAKPEVSICVPYTLLETAKKNIRGSKIKIGAQNIAWADDGAYTGEISAAMLSECGAEYVIIGHSERRAMFNETDESVGLRLRQALSHGFKPIVCIGETRQQREYEETQEVLSFQISKAFDGISAEEMKLIAVAYEPVWAIGTGQHATPELANETIKFIRKKLAKLYLKPTANKIRILYGGSVTPQNIGGFMSMSDIDGALVGGASFKVKDFAKIINYAKN